MNVHTRKISDRKLWGDRTLSHLKKKGGGTLELNIIWLNGVIFSAVHVLFIHGEMQITSISGEDISRIHCTQSLCFFALFLLTISFSTLCTLLEAIFTHESFTEASHPPSIRCV